QAVKVYNVDVRRSLVVTEKPILERFSFERVMQQLVDQSGVPGLTAAELFQQWWDTQNPGPGLGQGAHCDDQVDPTLGTVINGYPYLCRPAPSEGGQSTCDPFAPDSPCAYIPIALFNRFDQAPENGAHCGEHRIVFAKASGVADRDDRNTIIFEANVPNPSPLQGLKGCKKIVTVWGGLSDVTDIEARADKLEDFYFDGQGTLPPVLSLANFGDNPQSLGQVRTNQLVNTDTGWSMREFKLLRECSGSACTALRFVPVTNKTNAFGDLFDPASTHPLADDFRAYFPTQVAGLAANNLNTISMTVPDMFNSAQSQSSGTYAYEMEYLDRLGSEPSELRTAIAAELALLGSTLTVEDIVNRAQTTSCAGCHRLSALVDIGGGLVWPDSQPRFVHVTERETEIVDGVERFVISDGLLDVFLPHRKVIVDDFLNNKPRPPGMHGPTHPISGSADHG
ncbi:MAG TPA: hypothetical protein VFU02_22235, partial [Polyangiaceae bacterium]|nr:hypothetical protein [Polyangiaceae bacterium]